MKKNSKLGLAILIVLLILIIVGSTYAFYTGKIIKSGDNTASITTKRLGVVFQDGPEIVLDGILPGQKIIKTFSVTNSGTTNGTYHLEFVDVLNELTRKNDLVYTLTATNGGAELNETVFPRKDGTFASDIEIAAGVTQEYTMLIEYKNLDENQSADMNSHINATIQISDTIKLASVLPYIPDETDYTLDPSTLAELKAAVDGFNAANNINPIDWNTAGAAIFRTEKMEWWDYNTWVDCLAYKVYVYSPNSITSTWSENTDFSNFEFNNPDKYISINGDGELIEYTLISRVIGTLYNGWYILKTTPAYYNTHQYFGDKTLIHIENAKFDYYYYENYPIWVSKNLKTTDRNNVSHEFIGIDD